MLSRNSLILILSGLFVLTLASCNSTPSGKDINYNSPTPAQTITHSSNTSSAKTNVNTFTPFNPSNLNFDERSLEYFERMARNNKLKPPTYGNKCPQNIIMKIEGNEQLYGIGIHFADKLCKVVDKYDVRLRSGKICELPKGKIEDPLHASPEELLKAVDDCVRR